MKPPPEVGFNAEIATTVVKVTEHWVVCVTPMLFNDRVCLSRMEHWDTEIIAGWCYDKGPAAALAAMAWDPETEPRPVGFKRESHDSRGSVGFPEGGVR